MSSRWMACAVCASLALLALPLALQRIPPNPFYGVRTPAALADAAAWYAVNTVAGLLMVGAAVLAGVAVAALPASLLAEQPGLPWAIVLAAIVAPRAILWLRLLFSG